jgi:hypothetical protein
MGWKRGHAVVAFGHITKRPDPISLFRPGCFNCSATDVSPILSSPLPLPRTAAPVPLSCSESAQSTRLVQRGPPCFCFFLLAGRPQPGLCALSIICACNSTDPRFRVPVGIWAQSASHPPPTFVAWDCRLLKNWSPSSPWPSRWSFPWGSLLRGVMQDGACVGLRGFVRCFIGFFVQHSFPSRCREPNLSSADCSQPTQSRRPVIPNLPAGP